MNWYTQFDMQSTRTAPQAAYRNCKGGVRVKDRAGVGPVGKGL